MTCEASTENDGQLDGEMCYGLNSHYFHIIGDGHQPNSRGLYIHYKDSRQERLEEFIHPQYKELIDPGSNDVDSILLLVAEIR